MVLGRLGKPNGYWADLKGGGSGTQAWLGLWYWQLSCPATYSARQAHVHRCKTRRLQHIPQNVGSTFCCMVQNDHWCKRLDHFVVDADNSHPCLQGRLCKGSPLCKDLTNSGAAFCETIVAFRLPCETEAAFGETTVAF